MASKRSKLGRQIGVFLCLAGLILEWVGWNGAASYDRITEQFPFLLSGGVGGLSLIVIGAALIVVQSQRSERATLEQHLAGLSRILETLVEVAADIRRPDGGEGFVLAATTAYHRPTCGLLEDHPRLRTVTVESAVEEGLLACRTCHPPVPAQPAATTPAAGGQLRPEGGAGSAGGARVGDVETAVEPAEGAGDVWFAPPDEPETGGADLAAVPAGDDDVEASAAEPAEDGAGAEPGDVPEAVDDDEPGVGRSGGAEDVGEWTAGLPGPFPELVDNPWDAGDIAEDEVVVDLRSEELMTEAGAVDLAGDPVSRRE